MEEACMEETMLGPRRCFMCKVTHRHIEASGQHCIFIYRGSGRCTESAHGEP